MARGVVDTGRVGAVAGFGARWWWSYKRITVVVCCVNLITALFVLRWFYTSFYIVSSSNGTGKQFSEDQIRRIEESIRVRKVSEPFELVKAVRKLRKEWSRENKKRQLPKLTRPLRQQLTNVIVQTLKGLKNVSRVSGQQDAMRLWRINQLKEVKTLIRSKAASNSSTRYQEGKMLKRALESNWFMLLEDIGLWMPAQAINTEHDDRPENEQDTEEEIVAGRPLSPECHAELHTDYDGAAVRWGLTHHKESAADCCQACLDQAKYAKPGEMKCNIWVYCPSEFGCYSPDKYVHKHQECWLKQAEKPRLNFKDKYSESYRNNHRTAPVVVPWVSGVIGP